MVVVDEPATGPPGGFDDLDQTRDVIRRYREVRLRVIHFGLKPEGSPGPAGRVVGPGNEAPRSPSPVSRCLLGSGWTSGGSSWFCGERSSSVFIRSESVQNKASASDFVSQIIFRTRPSD